MVQPVKVFYCYDNANEDALLKLQKQLKPLERQGLIETWYNRQVMPGANYAQEVEAHLDQAQVIILLVSSDSLESEYYEGKEMARVLQLHQEAKVHVVPVLLHPSLWNLTPLKDLKPLPDNGRTISEWSNQGAAWHNVAIGIYALITNMQKQVEKKIEPRANGTKTRSKSHFLARQKRETPVREPIAEATVKVKSSRTARKARVIELPRPKHPAHELTSEEELLPVTSEAETATPEYDQHYGKLQDKINGIIFKILVWEPGLPSLGIVAEKRREISRFLEAEQHQCWLGKELKVPLGASLQDREIDQARDADLTVLLAEPLAIGELHEFCKHEDILTRALIFYPEEMKSAPEDWSLDKKLIIGYRNLEYYQEIDIIQCHVRTKVLNWVMARRSYRYSNPV